MLNSVKLNTDSIILLQNNHTSKKPTKLPAISKTPAPGSPKNHPKVLQTEKNDFELDLNTKHRILKSMVEIDKQHSSTQDASSLSFSFKRMSAGMKLLGNYTNQETLINKVFENIHNSNTFSYKVNESQSKAKKICIDEKNNSWAKKRGKNITKIKNNFTEFLDQFFESLDENKDESLDAYDIILPMMSYGVTLDSKYLERVKKYIGNKVDISIKRY